MESIITGPINGELNVYCNGQMSCFDVVFDAAESNKVSITGCKENESCLDISLYCPPNSNRIKNCFIEGNNNLGDTKLYAINGWNDIEIDYSGTFGPEHGGKMFCGDGYNNNCNIAPDDWSCGINSNQCRLPLIPPINIRPDLTGKVPSNTSLIYPLTESTAQPTSAELTNVYTSETMNKLTTNDTIDESSEKVGYGKKKKGISGWPLLTRILFGVGALILIICVGIGCYVIHKGKVPPSHPTHIKHGGNHSVHSWHGSSSLHRHSSHNLHSHHHKHSGHHHAGHHHHNHGGHGPSKQYSVTTTKDLETDRFASCQMVSRTPTPTNIHKDSDSLINNDYVHNNNNKTTEVIRFI